jgi:hypothetical protein
VAQLVASRAAVRQFLVLISARHPSALLSVSCELVLKLALAPS